MESRPKLASHCKKKDKGKNVCNEIAPKKPNLRGNDDGCKNNEKGAQENAENEEKNDKNESFWTVCPYCYYMYEYEKAFEECCLRCQNCKRAFHGVAVVEPNKNMLVEGKDEYYSGLGYFALKYSLKCSEKKKESADEGKSYNVGEVVEISDDSDENDGGGVNVKNGKEAEEDVSKGNVKGVMQESGNTEVINEGKKVVVRKNVKSVPWNSKKVMGRGMKIRKIDGGSVRGSGTGETDLEFIEKDGDVYVGVKSIFDGQIGVATMVLLQQLERGLKPVQSYYNSMTYLKKVSLTQGSISSNMICYPSLISKPISRVEAEELAAKKHSEAERRRRLRINDQFNNLRKILPNLVKVDKASVLAKTIKTVRELQRTVREQKALCQVHGECVFPSGANELSLRNCNRDRGMLKVTLSCEDQPELMSDLSRALRSVKGRLVRAEMVPVGGRIKCVLWVQGFRGNAGTVMLKRALNLVIDRPVSPGNRSKLRFYH